MRIILNIFFLVSCVVLSWYMSRVHFSSKYGIGVDDNELVFDVNEGKKKNVSFKDLEYSMVIHNYSENHVLVVSHEDKFIALIDLPHKSSEDVHIQYVKDRVLSEGLLRKPYGE